jgi:hypothetical protein
MSSPQRKNIPLPISANQNYNRAVSSPRRGVGRRHCTSGWDAVDAAALRAPDVAGRDEPRERWTVCRTSDASTLSSNFGRPHTACRGWGGGSCVRRSRVVLASVADAKSAEVMFEPTGSAAPSIRETTVTKRNSSPGRARRKPLKPFACGNAGCSGDPVVTTVCYYQCTRAAGATVRPAFPTPSKFQGARICKTRAQGVARTSFVVPSKAGPIRRGGICWKKS